MNIKNYTNVKLTDLAQMQDAANEIATEIDLTHTSSVYLSRLNESNTARAAERYFKAIVSTYYRVKAEAWLDVNGVEALSSEFDEWVDMAGAARATVLKEAGIKVNLYNGWFDTDTWL